MQHERASKQGKHTTEANKTKKQHSIREIKLQHKTHETKNAVDISSFCNSFCTLQNAKNKEGVCE